MKIGDKVYVHGYVDEIRKDVVIIRNDGGYFGTVESEVMTVDEIAEIRCLERINNKKCLGMMMAKMQEEKNEAD